MKDAATITATNPHSIKAKFLERWPVKGRTPEAYAEWQNLKFDPGSDDIEEFMNDVKNLGERLDYPEAAQLMAVKGVLPIEIYYVCLNIATVGELQTLLVKIFDNPKIKKSYTAAGTSSTMASSALSMGEYMNGENGGKTTTTQEIGQLKSQIGNLKLSMRQMSTANPRNRQVKYKPNTPKMMRFFTR